MRKAIKFFAVLSLFFIFSAFSVFAAEQKELAKAPSVNLPEANYHFSTIIEGKDIIHDFKIQNKGSARLDILKVKPG